MPREVGFIIQTPLEERDRARFGLDVFHARGFRTHVLDATRAVAPGYFEKYGPASAAEPGLVTEARTPEDVENALAARRGALWVVLFGCGPRTRFIYRTFKRFGINYMQFSGNSLPVPATPWFQKLSRLPQAWRSGRLREIFAGMLSDGAGGQGPLQPPRYVLADGRKFRPNSPAPDGSTEIVWAHCMDYDVFLEGRRKGVPAAEDGTALFLDEYYPFHPDYHLFKGMDSGMGPEEYYGPLNRFFDYLEGALGLRVVVAAHPRSHYEVRPDCFPGRRVEKGKTLELVSRARLVLAHASTAVNFAVMCRKPVLFLTSRRMERSYEGPYIRQVAAELGKAPLSFDGPFPADIKGEIAVDEGAYAAYAENYIKVPGTPEKPLWEIAADRLSKEKD